jgi:HPt (histidine-containing phosphotransfer) domain-containing protein
MRGRLTKPIDPELLLRTLRDYLPDAAADPAAARDPDAPRAATPRPVAVVPRAPEDAVFDPADGLRRVGGAGGLLRQLVARFARDHGAAEERRAIAERDDESRVRHVHSLRGVAGNLGMTRLWKAATALEAELRGGPFDPDSPVLRGYLATAEETHGAALRWLEEQGLGGPAAAAPPSAATGAPPVSPEVVDALAARLAEGDMAAEEILRAHEAGLRARWGERFDAVCEAVAECDLDRALALVRGA